MLESYRDSFRKSAPRSTSDGKQLTDGETYACSERLLLRWARAVVIARAPVSTDAVLSTENDDVDDEQASKQAKSNDIAAVELVTFCLHREARLVGNDGAKCLI